MIISPTKKQDMEARANMLYAIEVALKVGDTETAKTIGEASAKMADRIRHHDYSREDDFEKRVKEVQHGKLT